MATAVKRSWFAQNAPAPGVGIRTAADRGILPPAPGAPPPPTTPTPPATTTPPPTGPLTTNPTGWTNDNNMPFGQYGATPLGSIGGTTMAGFSPGDHTNLTAADLQDPANAKYAFYDFITSNQIAATNIDAAALAATINSRYYGGKPIFTAIDGETLGLPDGQYVHPAPNGHGMPPGTYNRGAAAKEWYWSNAPDDAGAKGSPNTGAPTPTTTTTTNARAPFVPLDASLSGNYDQALALIQQRAQDYLGRTLTDAEIAQIKAKYGDVPGSGPTTTTTPGARLTANRIDASLSGTTDQAIAYLNGESQRLRGTPLTDAEIQQAATLVGYQQGQPVTGAQVNTILGELEKQARTGPDTTTTSPGTPSTPHVYTAADINPILQDLYNRAPATTTTTTPGPKPTPTTGTTQTGTTRLGTIGQSIDPGNGFGSLLTPWTQQFSYPEFNGGPAFSGPTAETFQTDPGYGFRVDQGTKAIEHSAAARGTLLSGGTLKDLTEFGQGIASNEFSNVWGRAFNTWATNYNKARGEYDTNYAKASGEYAQNYNIFNNNQDRPFNKLSALSGLGQTATQQLNSAGANFAGNATNTLLGTSAQQGNLLTQGANATAAGLVGSANAYGSALGSIGNNAAMLAFLGRNSAYGQ